MSTPTQVANKNTMPCPNCKKVISVNSRGAMAKHQKTQTCQNYKKQVQAKGDKVQETAKQALPKPSSGGGVQSTKVDLVTEMRNWKNPHSPDCDCTAERLDNYDLWFEEGSNHFGKCLYQAVDDLRKPLTWSQVESEVVLKPKKSRNWKEGLVRMSRRDPDDEYVCYTNDELELMGGYASDSSHESYHGNGVYSDFSRRTQQNTNFRVDNEPIDSNLTIKEYSPKSFVVIGNTKEHKDKLKSLGGKWNANLTDKESGSRFGGWIFSNNKKKVVEEYIFQK